MKHIIALYLCISTFYVFAGSDCEECVIKNNIQGYRVNDDLKALDIATKKILLDEDLLADFCAVVELNSIDSIRYFNLIVTNQTKAQATVEEMKIFWNTLREQIICPEDEVSDPEHFIKKAVNSMNIDFIRYLGDTFDLDMNFAITDPDTNKKFTVLNFLKNKQKKLQKDRRERLAATSGKETTVTKALEEDINNYQKLIDDLKGKGAKYVSEL